MRLRVELQLADGRWQAHVREVPGSRFDASSRSEAARRAKAAALRRLSERMFAGELDVPWGMPIVFEEVGPGELDTTLRSASGRELTDGAPRFDDIDEAALDRELAIADPQYRPGLDDER